MKEFWLDNPSQLFTSLNFLPSESMSIDEKYNALTRLVILISVGMYFAGQTHAWTVLGVGILAVIILRNAQISTGAKDTDNKRDNYAPIPLPPQGELQRPEVRYRISADISPMSEGQTGETTFGYQLNDMEKSDRYDQPKLAFDPAASYKNVLRDYVSNSYNYVTAERELYDSQEDSRNNFQKEAELFYSMKKPRVKVYAS
jgi:hypothetical protein